MIDNRQDTRTNRPGTTCMPSVLWTLSLLISRPTRTALPRMQVGQASRPFLVITLFTLYRFVHRSCRCRYSVRILQRRQPNVHSGVQWQSTYRQQSWCRDLSGPWLVSWQDSAAELSRNFPHLQVTESSLHHTVLRSWESTFVLEHEPAVRVPSALSVASLEFRRAQGSNI